MAESLLAVGISVKIQYSIYEREIYYLKLFEQIVVARVARISSCHLICVAGGAVKSVVLVISVHTVNHGSNLLSELFFP